MKVVFVHGALVFDGAWWWHRMVEPLATLGLGSRAVELPSCVAPPGASRGTVGDMYADADAVRAALDEEDGPVVLVGHSYGGMLITDAAAGHGNVEHLVYVTSVMPERDETLAGLGGGREPGPWMDPRPEDGTMGVKAELLPEAFMQDCDEAAVAGALERLTRQPLAVFGQAPRAVAWHRGGWLHGHSLWGGRSLRPRASARLPGTNRLASETRSHNRRFLKAEVDAAPEQRAPTRKAFIHRVAYSDGHND